MRDLHHLRPPLFIYLFLLFWRAMYLGKFVAAKDSSGVTGKRRRHLEHTLNLDRLRAA